MNFLNANSDPAQLWKKLQAENLVAGELPVAEKDNSVWYIRAMLGFSGWIASLFLLGFFVTFFSLIFDEGDPIIISVIGLVLNLFAWVMTRVFTSNEFSRQLGLAINLCGQLIVALGIYEWFNDDSALFFATLFTYQCFVVLLIPQYTSRILSTWFALMAFFYCLDRLGIFDISASIVSLGFVLVWLFDFKWKNRRELWEPLGYGLAVSLLFFNSQIFFGKGLIGGTIEQPIVWLLTWSPIFSELLIVGLVIFILMHIVNCYKIRLNSAAGNLVLIAAVVLLLLNHFVSGASAGILLLIIGFMRQRRLLVAAGVAALLGFISWYYYHLEITLLVKSLLLLAFSFLFAVCLWVIEHHSKVNARTKVDAQADNTKANETFTEAHPKPKKITPLISITLGTLALALTLVNIDIFNKEKILSEGRLVLLKLAPVDPRSLMQGDYMNLRFEIENTLIDNLKNNKTSIRNTLDNSSISSDDELFAQQIAATQQFFDKRNDSGTMIINLDENQVGTLSLQQNITQLDEHQVKMKFKIRHRRLRLATHAFFFQEGTAAEYEKAHYGEFRVTEDGDLLLNNLRDEQFKVLGYFRPNN